MIIPNGTQILVDLYDCQVWPGPEQIHQSFLAMLNGAGFCVVSDYLYEFKGYGEITSLAVLSQSHAALHTWQEVRYLSVDIYTCGDHHRAKVMCEKAIDILKTVFQPRGYDVRLFERGEGIPNPNRISVG